MGNLDRMSIIKALGSSANKHLDCSVLLLLLLPGGFAVLLLFEPTEAVFFSFLIDGGGVIEGLFCFHC